MADLSFVKELCFDDSDEGVYEQGDCGSGGDIIGGDDVLTPLLRIKKYAESGNVYNRQMVSRVLLELFKLASPEGLTANLTNIMEIFEKLADEGDPLVRKDMLEHVPKLAALAVDCSTRVPALADVVADHLLPLVVRNLGTTENQVRGVAHSTLIALLEQGLVSKAQAEIKVCPNVLALSRKECLVHYHTDSVSLMSKMVPLLGRDVTERVFLDRFAELCASDQFYIRKICATHFGEFCAVVGKQSYEKILLPAYIKLSEDEIWGVRKACAEVAISVSCVSTPPIRKSVLAPVFVKFLEDANSWVRISAFQTLGPFISTFADPPITSLSYNEMGELVLINADGTEFRLDSSIVPTDEAKKLFELCLEDLNDADVEEAMLNIDQDKMDPLLTVGETKEATDAVGNGKEPVVLEEDGVLLCVKPVVEPEPQGAGEMPAKDGGEHSEFIADLGLDYELVDLLKSISGDLQISYNDGAHTDNRNGEDTATAEVKDVLDTTVACVDDLKPVVDVTTSALENESLNPSLDDDKTAATDPRLETPTTNDLPTGEGNDEADLDSYNSYNYWYVSPDMPLDPCIIDAGSPSEPIDNPAQALDSTYTQFNVNETRVLVPEANGTFVIKDNVNKTIPNVEPEEPPQYIVPQLLIDHFISMADPNMVKMTYNSVAYHCAYSLPAVALTLGSDNWHLLKKTVETLAESMQYKVRLTVASSLHELAHILGPDLASDSLLPLFNGFIKDLDEVRIGVLKHLAHFLKLIHPANRTFYLPRLSYFLQNNHELNWRFRYELAEQLLLALNLFPPMEGSRYIAQIALRLLCDKVSAVRQVAIQLVAELLRHISSEPGLAPRLLVKFAEKFAHSMKWKLRQTFVLLSAELLVLNALSPEQFSSEVMPHLLDLSWDPVANVRLSVATTISKHMITNEYFSDPENQHFDSLQTVLRRLQTDKDRDVRQAAQPSAATKNPH